MKHSKFKALSALCIGLVIAGCEVANSGPPDLQTMHEARPLAGTKEFKIELKYDVGQLEITKGAGENLFPFDLQYDRRRYNPAFHFDDGEHASMRLDVNGHSGGGGGRDNDLSVKLSDQVPLELDITTGVSESQLEMSSLQVRRMHLRGGVGKTEVSFDKPSAESLQSLDVESGVGELLIHGLGNSHVQRVDLKGGVGHTELDFTGDLGTTRSDATIKVGIGAIKPPSL